MAQTTKTETPVVQTGDHDRIVALSINKDGVPDQSANFEFILEKDSAIDAAKKESIMAEGQAVYTDMIAAMPKGAASKDVQVIVERWRRHLEYFWTPNIDQLLALANGYNDDPRFKANFDKMHPRLAEFMREAVSIYVANQKK